MKKQFSIKSAQLLKTITKSVAKAESSNVLKFVFDQDPNDPCCREYMLPRDIVALPR